MTVKEKKRAMRGYAVWLAMIKDIELEIKELRSSRMSAGMNAGDGMPHARYPSGMEGYAAQLDELERKLEARRAACVESRLRIEVAIETLTDPQEEAVMRLRYLRCMKWEDVADEMHYEIRHVFRIHGSALQHIRFPEGKMS